MTSAILLYLVGVGIEHASADLRTEIGDQEFRMAECYEKLDAINKIRQNVNHM